MRPGLSSGGAGGGRGVRAPGSPGGCSPGPRPRRWLPPGRGLAASDPRERRARPSGSLEPPPFARAPSPTPLSGGLCPTPTEEGDTGGLPLVTSKHSPGTFPPNAMFLGGGVRPGLVPQWTEPWGGQAPGSGRQRSRGRTEVTGQGRGHGRAEVVEQDRGHRAEVTGQAFPIPASLPARLASKTSFVRVPAEGARLRDKWQCVSPPQTGLRRASEDAGRREGAAGKHMTSGRAFSKFSQLRTRTRIPGACPQRPGALSVGSPGWLPLCFPRLSCIPRMRPRGALGHSCLGGALPAPPLCPVSLASTTSVPCELCQCHLCVL